LSKDKIKLSKDGGPIVFLGSMNAMPMMYAMELKKMGYPVLYFVDGAQKDILNRPENHFSDITYPYPSWIKELKVPSQMLIPFLRLFFSLIITHKISRNSQKKPQVYILNGFFITLSPLLKKTNNKVISLSHGSDLDSWGDNSALNKLSTTFVNFSLFKFLPKSVSKKLIELVINRQYLGLNKSDKVIYFPKFFNEAGDRVINKLKENNVKCYERYDVSFEPLKNEDRSYKASNEKLCIFSGVRFLYESFSEGNELYSKGNDIMIRGLSLFFQQNKNIEVHFVEKGPDVDKAKLLCDELGLSPVIIWHKEMKFLDLLKLYNRSDICFDQVGKHWVGAIGGYALWLGKPLIANIERPIKSGVWPTNNPILNATNDVDILNSLIKLNNNEFRQQKSMESKEFAENYFSSYKLINDIFKFSD
tara:strand:+ start:687 stop:1943 length:1257 start_codon:yes stop_codon:yes gene_type:complete